MVRPTCHAVEFAASGLHQRDAMISAEGENRPQPRVMLSSLGNVSSAYWKTSM